MSKSILTKNFAKTLAETLEMHLTDGSSNTYVMIGRPLRWGSDITETPDEVEKPIDTEAYKFQFWRDAVALKKVTAADLQLVVPRFDWANGTIYTAYNETAETYSLEKANAITGTVNVAISSTSVVGNSTIFTTDLSVGSILEIDGNRREVISIANNGNLVVNSAYSTTEAYTNETGYKITSNTYAYVNIFYVRNTQDQVFKCLFNNGNTASTIVPEINIDGQLPENPYISTSDGYRWKYLYTIPSGLKERFFTEKYMPVISEPGVTSAAETGRIDIIKINNGGSGYMNYSVGGNTNTAPIIIIEGDGTGANVLAKVESGVITGYTIIDGGNNYTTATITVDDESGSLGTGANLQAVISPFDGHGSDPATELGAGNLALCLELEDDEGGIIPTTVNGASFDYRQIGLIMDPLLTTGNVANGAIYRTTTLITTTATAVNYVLDEIAYQGDQLSGATFSGTVISWNPTSHELYLNNISGTFNQASDITGNTSGAVSTALAKTDSSVEKFTGKILYIENREKVSRSVDQIEQVRLVLKF